MYMYVLYKAEKFALNDVNSSNLIEFLAAFLRMSQQVVIAIQHVLDLRL